MKNSDRTGLDHHWSGSFGDAKSFDEIQDFQQMVLSFYKQHGRDLPWRNTTDPYRILVSEIMLQQTQVERVTKKFPEFIQTFSDFAALSRAPLADILDVWQGLGYNRRAILLQKCCVKVLTEYNGILPADVDILVTLPGIGRATASSIAAFVFNMPVVFIETNIRRVFIHFFFSPSQTVCDDEILPIIERTLYRTNSRIWYWALMDLGSELKKTTVNPNRRSAHYTKQTPFEGSDRKIRGIILRILLKEQYLEEEKFIDRLNEDRTRVMRILSALENEGFIQRKNKGYLLSD